MTAAVFDYETKTSYAVQVTSTDAGGLTYAKSFTITVTNANEAPTDISISASSIAEGASGRTVGSLSSTDQDSGDTFTYSITGGADSGALAFPVRTWLLLLPSTMKLRLLTPYRFTTTDAGSLTYAKTLRSQ